MTQQKRVIRLPRSIPRAAVAAVAVVAVGLLAALPGSEARSANAAAAKPTVTVTKTETQTVTVTATPTVTETVTKTETVGPTATVTVTATPTTIPTTTTTTPTTTATTTTTPPSSGWPDASNTGHSGTLTAYSGPCTIQTAGTVIDSKDVAGTCGFLNVRAANVLIKNSNLPGVEVNSLATASLTIQDSTVNIGQSSWSAVGGYNLTIVRSEILGGQHSVGAEHDVTVVDSWLHGQWNDPNASFHNNAFITNGGSNMTVRHNTLHCDTIGNSNGGGCTADVSLFGDWSPVSNVLVENNLLKASSSSGFCAYGGHQPAKPYPNSTGIQYRNNVFERGPSGMCGAYGPVTSFDPNAAGNVWSGNVWDDGAPVPSSD